MHTAGRLCSEHSCGVPPAHRRQRRWPAKCISSSNKSTQQQRTVMARLCRRLCKSQSQLCNRRQTLPLRSAHEGSAACRCSCSCRPRAAAGAPGRLSLPGRRRCGLCRCHAGDRACATWRQRGFPVNRVLRRCCRRLFCCRCLVVAAVIIPAIGSCCCGRAQAFSKAGAGVFSMGLKHGSHSGRVGGALCTQGQACRGGHGGRAETHKSIHSCSIGHQAGWNGEAALLGLAGVHAVPPSSQQAAQCTCQAAGIERAGAASAVGEQLRGQGGEAARVRRFLALQILSDTSRVVQCRGKCAA
jgi:hypothetical protein